MKSVVDLAYRSFGRSAPGKELAGRRHAAVWLTSLLFVIAGLSITLVLNFFSLFIGVLITFVGREGVRFRFLKLFGRLPVIAVSLPVLFGYAIWHHSITHGLTATLAPMLGVWVLGAMLVVIAAVWNRTDGG